MPDETSKSGEGSLPPKLDLRKTGVLKGHVWPAPDENSDEESADTQPTAAPAQPNASAPDEASAKAAARPVASPPAAKPAAAASSATAPQAKAAVPVARVAGAAPGPKPQVAKPVEPQSKAEAERPKAAKPAAPAAKPIAAKPAPAPRPSTARIKVPSEDETEQATQAPAAKPAAGAPPPPAARSVSGSKRETSKIPLNLAAAPAAGKKGPSTIKIKPAVKPSATQKAMPATPAATGATDNDKANAKKQTSRIPLESALAADTSGKKQAGGPKTIRLKRPGSASTVKATPPTATKPEAADAGEKESQAGSKESAPADPGALGKTSRLDAAAAESEPATPTRKKTIRVKRPTQKTSVKKELSVARPEGAPAEAGGPQRLQPPTPIEAPPERVGWFFGLCGIAATLLAVAVIYMLLAQVLGSNSSMTQLAYGAPDLNLPWTGEIETQ